MVVIRLRVKIGLVKHDKWVALFSALEIDILKIELDLTRDSRVNANGVDKIES